MYQHIKIPAEGKKIQVNTDNSLTVPDNPIIPFIEGDGIGIDITPVMRKVVDSAVEKAYRGQRKSPGWKFMQVKNLRESMVKMCGFRKKHCKPPRNSSFQLKAFNDTGRWWHSLD